MDLTWVWPPRRFLPMLLKLHRDVRNTYRHDLKLRSMKNRPEKSLSQKSKHKHEQQHRNHRPYDSGT